MSSKVFQTNLSHHRGPDDYSELTETPDVARWLQAVLAELDPVRKHFKPNRVHNLRVALRRCRSVAMGVEQLDPSPAWSRLRKASKRLLDALGETRDVQVMRGWVVRLGMNKSDSGLRLCAMLDEREANATRMARKELDAVEQKQWRKWSRQLPERTDRIQCGGTAAELLALQGWVEAWELHRTALRSRSKVSFHRLRVGLKRFRYTVESFLPGRYARWGGELKKLQDLLGEVHDLDVLWAALLRLRPGISPEEREKWRSIIESERSARIAAYRAKMTGPKSRWQVWRSALPDGDALERARLDWLTVWASYLDPDPAHSQIVARISTELYDGIKATRVPIVLIPHSRTLLEAAAILDDVGRAEGDRHHQKTSYRLIRGRIPPPGWSSARMETIARIARYHRGELPHPHENHWGKIPAKRHAGVMFLAGILRLVTALESDKSSPVAGVHVEKTAGALVIHAKGYTGDEPLASRLAAARHLLESLLHCPIVIEPAPVAPLKMATPA